MDPSIQTSNKQTKPKTEVITSRNGLKYVICSDYCCLRWNPSKQTSYKSILLLPGPFPPPFHVTKRHIIRNESFRSALCFWQTGDDDWSESSPHPPQLESTLSSSHPIEADGESAFRGRGNWTQHRNTNCKRIPVMIVVFAVLLFSSQWAGFSKQHNIWFSHGHVRTTD